MQVRSPYTFTVHSQKRHRVDASVGFYRLDKSLSSGSVKPVGFIKMHQFCENQTWCNLIFADLLQIAETTCIKLVNKKSWQSTCIKPVETTRIKLYRLTIYWSTYFVTHESSYENNFSPPSCRCGCANVFRGIIVEGDECCKANTSGFISQVPSHDCVEPVFTCFKNDVCTRFFFHLIDDTLAITNKNTSFFRTTRNLQSLKFRPWLLTRTSYPRSMTLDFRLATLDF